MKATMTEMPKDGEEKAGAPPAPLCSPDAAKAQRLRDPPEGLSTQRPESWEERREGWEYFLDTFYFPVRFTALFIC